eukprot:TRINITY_DN3646_c0_g1_i4.p1 TRINITY_DN3646_c0_g1~~TRINITY_DN3646_c0_g1_i4.p1  ORF type:complete len:192 (-),score=53.09 TRINITY_DN3646_c0_g1_i4:601-1176(-)
MAVEREKNALKGKIGDLSGKLAQLAEALAQAENQNKGFLTNLTKLQLDHMNKEKEKQDEIDELRGELEALKQEKGKLESALATMNEIRSQLGLKADQNKDLQEQLKDLASQVDDSMKQSRDLMAERDDLNRLLEAAQNALASVALEGERAKQEIAARAAEVQRLIDDINGKSKENEDLRGRLSSLLRATDA